MLKIGSKVVDNDKGLDLLKKNIKQLHGNVIQIGILEKDGQLKYKRGASLATVAAGTEFGQPALNIPEWRWMRSTFDNKEKSWAKDIAQYMSTQSVRSTLNRRVTVFAGKLIRDDIKKTIRTIKKPKNSPRTIRNKGFDNPLIETKTMLNKISFEVKKTSI